jgi:hypothetical protein
MLLQTTEPTQQREPAVENPRLETQPAAQSAAPKEVAAPPAPKAGPAAHDIRLEVAGGERRVEVRLTQRGGEVRVAVRTADPRLGVELRENLPTLSSRLTESGFHTETWHPASAATGQSRSAETTTGNLTQDANPQSRQQGGGQQSDADARRAKVPEEQIQHKEKGKDFQWLMSTLQ